MKLLPLFLALAIPAIGGEILFTNEIRIGEPANLSTITNCVTGFGLVLKWVPDAFSFCGFGVNETHVHFRIEWRISTNWTGFNEGTNELGLVKSNLVASVGYAGASTNEVTLQSLDTGEHRWRGNIINAGIMVMTNIWFPTNSNLLQKMVEGAVMP
jgi:hypothetical protein